VALARLPRRKINPLPNVETYITEAALALGFTKEEWVQLRQFKQSRNDNTHEDFSVTQAYAIVDLVC
jgi:hypothetical protein